jgi:hypothetical protein
VRTLVDAGADLFSTDGGGFTPLASAARHSRLEEVAILTAAEQARHLAFAMGHHERLGAASVVRGLEPEVLRMVLECECDSD